VAHGHTIVGLDGEDGMESIKQNLNGKAMGEKMMNLLSP
jgi:hypothetical protein